MTYDPLSTLVQSAQEGDDLAFTELVRSFQDLAVAYAQSVLGDFALAEDAAQEAFIEAHTQLRNLREPRAFISWFRTIIFKHCDRMTRRRRHVTTDIESAGDVPSKDPTPEEAFECGVTDALVREVISDLPESERTVVLLFYMGDQSHSEVADFLGLTANAVKTRLYSARNRMREQLLDGLERSLRAARPSRDSQFARRVINATLPIQVYSVRQDGSPQPVGSTVGSRTPEVPNGALWFIEPRQSMTDEDWSLFLDLAERMEIPGMSIPESATDELLQRVSKVRHLRYLNIRDSVAVTDSGIRHLPDLQRLEHLDLSGTAVSDSALAVLANLSLLKTFEIRHQPNVSDTGLSHLRNCNALERVNLMGTRSGDGAVSALVGKPHLREFFAGSLISDDGLAMFREFPVFKTWRGRQGDLSLFSFSNHPTYLWLNLAAPFTDSGLAALSGLNGLYALNLFGTAGHQPFDPALSEVTDRGLEFLGVLPNLRWLGCCSTLCTDEAMSHISMVPGLRFLMCQDAVAGDQGFDSLSGSQSLEYIWGRRCYNLGGRGFAALAKMGALRGLAVSCKNVEESALSALPSFPSLRELMPIDVTNKGFRHVGRCSHLRALHCMYCPEMSDEGTEHLSGLQKLQVYGAWSSQITDRSLTILAQLRGLEKLHFYKCPGITDQGLAVTANLPRLRQLDLQQLPNVTEDAALAFSASVRVNYMPFRKGEVHA